MNKPQKPDFEKELNLISFLLGSFIIFLLVIPAAIVLYHSIDFSPKPRAVIPLATESTDQDTMAIEDGTDVETGLIVDNHLQLVKANCTGCHSPMLITQNRATREGWRSMIRWMQDTQKLWDLGENEGPILDYLAKNYPPENSGRRKNLSEIEWYVLD